VRESKNELAKLQRKARTIDPIIRIARRHYPYLSDREIQDYAASALRVILNERYLEAHQTSLLAHIFD
jgi:hypothetical protein